MKDLGVIVDDNLTFASHIGRIVVQSSIRANLILKCFMSRNVPTLVRAYKVYVRPLLEYATCAWSPSYANAIHKIESVQRIFTKRLPGYVPPDHVVS